MNGEPISGAIIKSPLINTTILSDNKGYFSFQTHESKLKIHISHLGYLSQELEISAKISDTLTVYLQVDEHALDEVVVTTGYQSIPKERATGSFSFVNRNKLDQVVSTNILDRLPAMANGIMMDNGTSNSGQLLIRGLSSIQGPKAPLIVIDNFPYEGDINNINPNIVESISILRDAAATSIWGARAANGVIVIKTKVAKDNQELNIELFTALSLSKKPNLNKIPLISSSDLIDVEIELFKRGFFNADINSTNRTVLSPIVNLLNKEKNGIINNEELTDEINLLRQNDIRQQFSQYMYKTAKNQQYFLNLSHGTQSHKWSSSVGYDNNLASLGDNNERFNIRFNNSYQVFKNAFLSNSLYYNKLISKSGRLGYGDILVKNNFFPSYLRFADEKGNPLNVPTGYNQSFKDSFGASLQDWNYYPLNDWEKSYSIGNNNEILLSTGVNYQIFKNLKADIKYQYQQQQSFNERINTEDSYFARNYTNMFAQISTSGGVTKYVIPQGGIHDRFDNITKINNFRAQLNYDNNWGNHDITALAGGEVRKNRTDFFSNRIYGVNSQNLTIGNIDYVNTYPSLINGSRVYIQNNESINTHHRNFLSYFTNFAYSYDKKYILSGSARKDASNLFGLKTNDQWNPFWSIGGAWIISNEKFFKSSLISNLKLRATHGFNGNIDPAMVAVSTIAFDGSNSFFTGTRMARFANFYNPKLQWETVEMNNFAVDFELANNMLYGSVEYFIKNGENLFGTTPVDYTTGVSTSLVMNVASMRGEGLDVELNSNVVNKDDFKWTAQLNFSLSKDKVTDYYQRSRSASFYVGNGSSVPISAVEGRPVYGMYAYQWGGLDPQTGDPLGFVDGEISKEYTRLIGSMTMLEDLKYFGSAIPRVYGSFNHSFTFHNISLNMSFLYKLDYWFRRKSINYSDLYTQWNGHADYAIRWRSSGDELNTNVPSNLWVTNSARDMFYLGSSPLVESGSHLRLQYINIAYTITNLKLKGMSFKSLQVFLNANNIGLIWRKNNHNIDPDFNPTTSTYMPSSVYAFGIRVNL